MNCKICGKIINEESDIHYLDEFMVCSDCYERAVDDAREVTPAGEND